MDETQDAQITLGQVDPVLWFWVGHTTGNKLCIEGPWSTEDEAVECDVQMVGALGNENFAKRHTCPVLSSEAATWKRKLLLNFAKQKNIRKDQERRKGNTSSQFRDVYGV